MSAPPYRDGRVHVQAQMCATCIFRPGNLMHLQRGRVREMVDKAKEKDTAIVCHDTYDGEQAVCRGFFDAHPTAPLQIAERLDRITWV